MPKGARESFFQNFRRFFLRGLAIVLPTVLTIWVLTRAYAFVDDTIAEPINQGVRNLVVHFTPYPKVEAEELQVFLNSLDAKAKSELLTGVPSAERLAYEKKLDAFRYATTLPEPAGKRLEYLARRDALLKSWRASPYPLDLMGVIIAVVVIYLAGGLLGSFIGWRVYSQGERLVGKVPLIRSVYPSIKQLTDFFVGGRDDKKRFKRVVAVQYQRPGIWSIGLVTGESIPTIDKAQGSMCIPVFMPSSPTMTGVLAYVPEEEILDLPLTIDEALRIIISGGVVMPASTQSKQQVLDLFAGTEPPRLEAQATEPAKKTGT